jgi:hypothetical protein
MNPEEVFVTDTGTGNTLLIVSDNFTLKIKDKDAGNCKTYVKINFRGFYEKIVFKARLFQKLQVQNF